MAEDPEAYQTRPRVLRRCQQSVFDRRSGPKIMILSIHILAVVIVWCAVRSIAGPANFEQVFMLIRPSCSLS
jgi:hypothetical protein